MLYREALTDSSKAFGTLTVISNSRIVEYHHFCQLRKLPEPGIQPYHRGAISAANVGQAATHPKGKEERRGGRSTDLSPLRSAVVSVVVVHHFSSDSFTEQSRCPHPTSLMKISES